jgi:putative heme-binding domain-containing protein
MRVRAILAALVLACGPAGATAGRDGERAASETRTNPLAGDPTAIEQGRIQFRQWCGHCHGRDAGGGAKGPDLASGQLRHGSTDERLYDTILAGVPGTQMPASDLTEQETWQIVAFLRSLAPPAAGGVSGDAKAGERLFWGDAKCSTCHMVGGRGGRRGPDLTRVGAARPVAFLVESIREPSRHFTERMAGADFGTTPIRFVTVTLTPRQGEEVVGLLVNEDNFNVVVMDEKESIRSYSRKDLERVVRSSLSLMPAYDEAALSARELQDLLAYMDGLRGR